MSAAKARVEFDPFGMGLKFAIRLEGYQAKVLTYGAPTEIAVEEGGAGLDADAWTSIPEDAARALYEALAEYFGGSGHDTRALRRDYDAERARVDRLVGYLIGAAS